jgi:hypothetical protein
MTNDTLYKEKLSSRVTEGLFIGLCVVFLALSIWMLARGGSAFLRILFIVLFIFFLFYAFNYRILVTRITAQWIKLQFGVFSWTIPRSNIQAVEYDDPPLLAKYGGAGIHFIVVRGRYRASFNFLEHSRVIVSLKRKVGPVADISFSTRHPDEIIRLLQPAGEAPGSG